MFFKVAGSTATDLNQVRSKMTKPIEIAGLIRDESNEAYHGNSAVSSTKFKDFIERPSLYEKKHINKLIKQEWSDALRFGAGLHYAMEGEDAYNKNCYFLKEDFSLRSKANKELWHDIIHKIKKVPIKHAEQVQIQEAKDSILSHPIAAALLSCGEAELTWRLAGEEYSMQCRTDFMCLSAPDFAEQFGIEDPLLPGPCEPYIVDYKTCQSLEDWTSDGYNNTIAKFGYDIQNVFYQLIVNVILKEAGLPIVEHFIFIVTEKKEPRETAVFILNLDTILAAKKSVIDNLERMAECFRTGVWPGYCKDVIETGISERVRDARAINGVNSQLMLR